MAVSVAALRTLQRLHQPLLGWLTFGAGTAGSALVGYSRVASGGHFPSDVLIGERWVQRCARGRRFLRSPQLRNRLYEGAPAAAAASAKRR